MNNGGDPNFLSLDEWVRFVFDRPEADMRSAWYLSDDLIEPEIPNKVLCEYVAHVFGDLDFLIKNYSLPQLAAGINYIVNPSVSYVSYALLDFDVPEGLRLCSISKMRNVYIYLFDKWCGTSSDFLDYVCYMWWDFFPRHGFPFDVRFEKTDSLIVSILGDILCLGNFECKRSALHGLGHWFWAYPDAVKDSVRIGGACIPHELRGFANDVVLGRVQ